MEFLGKGSDLPEEKEQCEDAGCQGLLVLPNPYEEFGTRVALIITYAGVFSMCFFGNLLVLFVITRKTKMRTRTDLFLGNLAVADILVGVFCVLPNLCHFLFHQWMLGRALCKLHQFVEAVNLTASMFLMEVIAVERYIVIRHPLKARRIFTRHKMYLAQLLVWLISAAYNVPFLFMYELVHDWPHADTNRTRAFCSVTGTYNIKLFHLHTFLLWYVLPLIVMSAMYAQIARTLWSSTLSVPHSPTQSRHIASQSGDSASQSRLTASQSKSHDRASQSCRIASQTRERASQSRPTASQSRSISQSRPTSLIAVSSICSESEHKACHLGNVDGERRTLTGHMTHSGIQPAQAGGSDVSSFDVTTTRSPYTSGIIRPLELTSFVFQDRNLSRSHNSPMSNISPTSSAATSGSDKRPSSARPSFVDKFRMLKVPRVKGAGVTSHLSSPPETPGGRIELTEGSEVGLDAPINRQDLDKVLAWSSTASSRSRSLRSSNKIVVPKSSLRTKSQTELGLYHMTSQRNSRRRVIRLLVVVLVTFAVLVLPNQVRQLLVSLDRPITLTRSSALFPLVCHVMVYFNSALNPILYSIISRNFRRSLHEAFAQLRMRGRRFLGHA